MHVEYLSYVLVAIELCEVVRNTSVKTVQLVLMAASRVLHGHQSCQGQSEFVANNTSCLTNANCDNGNFPIQAEFVVGKWSVLSWDGP
jgi:hypothetical protein